MQEVDDEDSSPRSVWDADRLDVHVSEVHVEFYAESFGVLES